VTIWFLFFADKLVRTGQLRWWLPTALFATLSALSKLPFFMAAGFCSLFLLFLNRLRAWRPWFLLAGAGAVAAAVFVVWTRYTDALAAQAVYPHYELRLSQDPWLVFFYFGDWRFRLSPGPWLKGAWRFLHATVGALPLAGLLLAGLFQRGNRLPKVWLLATFLTTLVFTHLVLASLALLFDVLPSRGVAVRRRSGAWRKFLAATARTRLAAGGISRPDPYLLGDGWPARDENRHLLRSVSTAY